MNTETVIRRINRFLESRSSIHVYVILSAVIMYLDYLTGRNIRLVYLMIIPAAAAVLKGHLNFAYMLSVILPLSRVFLFSSWGEAANIQIGLINAVIRSFVNLFICFYFDRAKKFMEIQSRIEIESRDKHIRALEEILPICFSCKKIRNRHGIYEPVETYLKSRSDMVFTHTCCPECMKKLYPDFMDNSSSG